jgi:cation diffusion facilitator CzcD-associated flavoprotein CzcO
MGGPVLVVGAGPAGLATAASLRKRGFEALVVDRGSAVGDSWRKRYDRLHLHTPRIPSAQPGMRSRGAPGAVGAPPRARGPDRPRHRGCVSSGCPALKGLLVQLSLDARAASRAIDRELRRS